MLECENTITAGSDQFLAAGLGSGYNPRMQTSPSGLQLRLVAASYAVVLVAAAALIFERYLLYVRHPQEAAAAGGMFAGGDLALEIMICCMLLVPTGVLVWVIRKSEAAYTTYAKMLLGLSITGPLSLIFLFVPFLNQWYWGDVCIFRLFAIPIVLVVLIASRFLARFDRARRLIFYGLLVEGLTLAGVVGFLVFFLSAGGQHR